MSTTAPFTLETSTGPALHGLIDFPEIPGPRPTVVICHGFKGFMEWGFFPYLAELLADRGFTTVRFNVSGTGMLPGEDLVSDPAAFRENTHSRELADLLAVLENLDRIAPGRVDHERLGLLGHSRGGGNVVLAAALPPWLGKVRALVTWAAVAGFDRYSPEQKEAWRRDGELPVANARTGQKLALGLGLLEDLESNAAVDVLAAAGNVRAPWLIIHGDQDESVDPGDAGRLAERAGGSKELVLVPGGSHTFGSRHPFAGPTPQLIQAMNATQIWFRRFL